MGTKNKTEFNYIVYRTTNIVTNEFYIGAHKTKNPYDEYVGSGRYIQQELKLYGLTRLNKKVLFIYDNPSEAWMKEEELVEIFRPDPMCRNIRQGGAGGFDWINSKPDQSWRKEQGIKNIRKAQAAYKYLLETDEEFRIAASIRSSQALSGNRYNWTGKTHKEETKKKIGRSNSVSVLGPRNSQYGTFWITDGTCSIKWHGTKGSFPDGFRKGRNMSRNAK